MATTRLSGSRPVTREGCQERKKRWEFTKSLLRALRADVRRQVTGHDAYRHRACAGQRGVVEAQPAVVRGHVVEGTLARRRGGREPDVGRLLFRRIPSIPDLFLFHAVRRASQQARGAPGLIERARGVAELDRGLDPSGTLPGVGRLLHVERRRRRRFVAASRTSGFRRTRSLSPLFFYYPGGGDATPAHASSLSRRRPQSRSTTAPTSM